MLLNELWRYFNSCCSKLCGAKMRSLSESVEQRLSSYLDTFAQAETQLGHRAMQLQSAWHQLNLQELAADSDNDGVVDRQEFDAMSRIAESFDELDANQDGVLDARELEAVVLRAQYMGETLTRTQLRILSFKLHFETLIHAYKVPVQVSQEYPPCIVCTMPTNCHCR